MLYVASAHRDRDDIVFRAMDQKLLAVDLQLLAGGFTIMFRHALRRTAEKFCYSVIAQMQLPGLAQIDDSGERDYCSHGVVMGGERERQLPACRMPQNDSALGGDGILAGELPQELIARSHVFEAAGPAA